VAGLPPLEPPGPATGHLPAPSTNTIKEGQDKTMQKWIRRSLYAGLTAGVAAGSAGVAHADDTTVVAPTVKSQSTSVIGDNSIAGGNSLSAPVVVPITGNDVAVAGIGGAVNAEDVLAVLGVLGFAHASKCGSDDYTEVSGWVRSDSTSVVGDNSIGSGNTASVPVYAPVTENDVAVAGIGGAVNGDNVSAVAGILGAATCGDGGDNGTYDASSEQYGEDMLPLGGLPLGGLPVGDVSNVSNLVNVVGVDDALALTENLPTGDVASLLGLGLLGGAGLDGAADTVRGTVDTATSQVAPVADAATQATGDVTGAQTTEAATTEAATTTESGSGDDTTVVAPHVKSESTSVVGDNSIGSGNSLSLPIVAPVTGNDVAVAGIGGAVNAEDVNVVAGVLGVASALLD
jgi:hypothetical protein